MALHYTRPKKSTLYAGQNIKILAIQYIFLFLGHWNI